MAAALAAAALGSQLHVWDLGPGLHAMRLELQVQHLVSHDLWFACCTCMHCHISLTLKLQAAESLHVR